MIDLEDDFLDVESLLSLVFVEGRLRVGFSGAFAEEGSEASFNGTLAMVARGIKKSLVAGSGVGVAVLGAYWPVTISVIVRAFFFGALLLSGDVVFEVFCFSGISISCSDVSPLLQGFISYEDVYLNSSSLHFAHRFNWLRKYCFRGSAFCISKSEAGKHARESTFLALNREWGVFFTR